MVENLEKIALLIDADNTQLSKIEAVLQEISLRGRIVVKRAYGNWKKEALKNWENELKRLAIKAEQQFDYVAGKNATDMALVIDTVNLLHKGIYDAFVIVASDSDYTPLAINLHESGVIVIGVGIRQTPEAFRNSCDEFIFLENLGTNTKTGNPVSPQAGADHENQSSKSLKREDETGQVDEIEEIHKLLKLASDKYEDDDGFVNVSSAGQFIKRVKPDFDTQTFGYLKLPELIKAYPKLYEVKRYKGKGTVMIIAYRCK